MTTPPRRLSPTRVRSAATVFGPPGRIEHAADAPTPLGRSAPTTAGLPREATDPRRQHPAFAAEQHLATTTATGDRPSAASGAPLPIDTDTPAARSIQVAAAPLLHRTARTHGEHEPKVSHR